jgi:hypothetical protein
MMGMQKLWIPFLFLFQTAIAAPVTDPLSEQEACDLLVGCMGEFDELFQLKTDVQKALKVDVCKRGDKYQRQYTKLNKKIMSQLQQEKRSVGKMFELADSCYELKSEYKCPYSKSQVDAFLKKVTFQEHSNIEYTKDGEKKEYRSFFKWTSDRKEQTLDLLREAFCKSKFNLDKVDGIVEEIVVSNSNCFDVANNFFQRLFNDTQKCHNAMVSHEGSKISVDINTLLNSRVVHQNPNNPYPTEVKGDFARVLSHELAHVLEFGDKDFRKKSSEFYKLRFSETLKSYGKELKKMIDDGNYTAKNVEALVKKYKIPYRDNPAEGIFFLPHATKKIARMKEKGFNDALDFIDTHALHFHRIEGFTGSSLVTEYLAYAVEFYYHDPEKAQEFFDPAELQWLDENLPALTGNKHLCH